MRGVEDFERLWCRRTTLQGEDGTIYELMSFPDLVPAKKTQRDKDWPMIRRFIEADYAACTGTPRGAQIPLGEEKGAPRSCLSSWREEVPAEAERLAADSRPLLQAANKG